MAMGNTQPLFSDAQLDAAHADIFALAGGVADSGESLVYLERGADNVLTGFFYRGDRD
ncbi:MAG: hypothetical protein J5I81_13800 [Nitrococcus mobilis]|nr:hypothetical protein [Nitrococcus mobilis]